VLYDSGEHRASTGAAFNEDILLREDIAVVEEGHRLMDLLIRGHI
jgi:hypothetical protein